MTSEAEFKQWRYTMKKTVIWFEHLFYRPEFTGKFFNPILDRVRDTPMMDKDGGGGQKAPPPSSLTLPFGVWQQWNLVGKEYRPRTFQNNKIN